METYDPNERFRERRRAVSKTQTDSPQAGAIALLLAAAAVAVGAGPSGHRGDQTYREPATTKAKAAAPGSSREPPPAEIRGVHVTMALASTPGKLGEYTRFRGEHDPARREGRERRGRVPPPRAAARASRSAPRSATTTRSRPPSRCTSRALPDRTRRLLRGSDPVGEAPRARDSHDRRRRLAQQRRPGWTNPYDKRVWDYNLRHRQGRRPRRLRRDPVRLRALPERRRHRVRSVPGQAERGDVGLDRRASFTTRTNRLTRWARASQSTSSGSRRRVISESASRPAACRKSSTRSTRWFIRPTTAPASTGLDSPVSVPGKTVGRSLRDFRRQMRRGKAQLGRGWRTSASRVRRRTRTSRSRFEPHGRWRSGGFLLWNPSGVYTTGALNAE